MRMINIATEVVLLLKLGVNEVFGQPCFHWVSHQSDNAGGSTANNLFIYANKNENHATTNLIYT